MRWEECTLLRETKTGTTDVLNNPICELQAVKEIAGRITEWSAEEIASLDREVLQTQRKALLRLPKTVFKGHGCTHVRIDGETYKIGKVAAYGERYTLAHVTLYKPHMKVKSI